MLFHTVYGCKSCPADTITTFPRYNSARKLLQTRRGRCGEYANLFGLYCRAVGFETRYILDLTDHVWIECLVDGDTWVMADSCEGLIDKAAMYEDGWGKKLSYQLGVTIDSVMDVSPRYTRQWLNPEYQERRRQICSSESTGEMLIAQCRGILRQGLSKTRFDDLDRRTNVEQTHLNKLKTLGAWTNDEKHGRGRISGSLQWKVSRQEAGTNQSRNEGKNPSLVSGLVVEQFYPQGATVTISVTPNVINVSGADCDVCPSTEISVVVIDEFYIGCILQSRGFDSWERFGDFVSTLPSHRIVACKGLFSTDLKISPTTEEKLNRLGGLIRPIASDDGILYIGQVDATPEWSISTSFGQSTGIEVCFLRTTEAKTRKLRIEQRTVPQKVVGRLDESIMPFQNQLLASDVQKKAAFISFVEKVPTTNCIGFTSKKGYPIYLLDISSFPFRQTDDIEADTWNTWHLLPPPVVAECDNGVAEVDNKHGSLVVDIPVDRTFFAQLLGPSLLVNVGGIPTLKDTPQVLHNSRLVAIYFSAHWCGPCRSFTPTLVELYSVLKDAYPSHGLEIVFVSSDRDTNSFNNYFTSMPWLAVPFHAGTTIQQQIKMTFGVNGIPSLVVLDAMSGQIVVTMPEARGEVMQACRDGQVRIDEMMKSWLARIPSESQEVLQMLEMSVADDNDESKIQGGLDGEGRREHNYCIKKASSVSVTTKIDPAERIKELFATFVSEGSEPNTAALKAIEIVSNEQKEMKVTAIDDTESLHLIKWTTSVYAASGKLEDVKCRSNCKDEIPVSLNPSNTVDTCVARILLLHSDGDKMLSNISDILSKYLDNAIRDPSNPKFRSMKLSNKVVDLISRVVGGLDLMCSLGFHIYSTFQDFMVCIPLSANLNKMKNDLEAILVSRG